MSTFESIIAGNWVQAELDNATARETCAAFESVQFGYLAASQAARLITSIPSGGTKS